MQRIAPRLIYRTPLTLGVPYSSENSNLRRKPQTAHPEIGGQTLRPLLGDTFTALECYTVCLEGFTRYPALESLRDMPPPARPLPF